MERSVKQGDELLISRRRNCGDARLGHVRVEKISHEGNILLKDVQPSSSDYCSPNEVSSRGDWYKPCVFTAEGEFKIEEFLN
ncbi:MAG: hypothetical protein AB7U37_05860 [Synergistaceae bacterium]